MCSAEQVAIEIPYVTIYNSIKPKGTSDNYTVLAALSDIRSGQILALASGTQACLRVYQDDLQDCHAESLVKRAYKRYLINSLLAPLKGGADQDEFEQIVELEKSRHLALFITQFPCGLIRRYEGEEPVDQLTGQVIKRKPGRGVVKDGRTVYVEKNSCLEKLQIWSQKGLQGSKLAQYFGIKSSLKKIIVGNCEPDERLDYDYYAKELKSLMPTTQVELVDNVRLGEFLYTPNKQPQPVALVAVKKFNNFECEYIVDGRKRGLSKKHWSSEDRRHKLSIANSRLREDIELSHRLYVQLRDAA